MSRIGLGLALAALLTASSCRLTDPIYHLKPLGAVEPHEEGQALLFGSISLEQEVLLGRVHTVVLERVSPSPLYISPTHHRQFRAFRVRDFARGDFTAVVSPGVWEVTTLESSGGCLNRRVEWRIMDEAREASRIHVTRPGIYDLGTLRIGSTSPLGVRSALTIEPPAADPRRRDRLARAVRGTFWERYLDPAP
jgi:hypothetical protein